MFKSLKKAKPRSGGFLKGYLEKQKLSSTSKVEETHGTMTVIIHILSIISS